MPLLPLRLVSSPGEGVHVFGERPVGTLKARRLPGIQTFPVKWPSSDARLTVPAIAFRSVARLAGLKPAHAQPPLALHDVAALVRPRPSGRPI
jgi:hypothetical protein